MNINVCVFKLPLNTKKWFTKLMFISMNVVVFVWTQSQRKTYWTDFIQNCTVYVQSENIHEKILYFVKLKIKPHSGNNLHFSKSWEFPYLGHFLPSRAPCLEANKPNLRKLCKPPEPLCLRVIFVVCSHSQLLNMLSEAFCLKLYLHTETMMSEKTSYIFGLLYLT